MKERVAKMAVEEGLKKDLDISLEECHKFATCLPDSVVSKPAALMGFGRQMVFFSCFKVRTEWGGQLRGRIGKRPVV